MSDTGTKPEVYLQTNLADENEHYRAFVEKFTPKKTTDDCYTPDLVMDAVNAWVAQEYGLNPSRFVRPFWPGGDYERHEYPDGCAVVDNPPFSILRRICDFYNARGIPFFLFAPTLTGMQQLSGRAIEKSCVILCGVRVTYANGAEVNTSFVTNMDREYCLRTCPTLYAAVQAADNENRKSMTKYLPKYVYPHDVVCGRDYVLARYGQAFQVKRGEAVFVRKLDMQQGKVIFGGGLLISKKAAAEKAAAEKAAAEKAAAEKAAATVWRLSDREKQMQKHLGCGG